MNKADYLDKELALLLSWIKATDSRIALVLPLATAMLGTLAAVVNSAAKLEGIGSLVFVGAASLLVLSIACLAFASFPRTNGPEGSIIFFGSVAKQSVEAYREAINALDEQRYLNDLIDQCHVNSKIATIKFNWVKRSLALLFMAAPLWFLAISYLYGS